METPYTTHVVTVFGINCPIFYCIGIRIDLFGFLLGFRLMAVDSPVNNKDGPNQRTKLKI